MILTPQPAGPVLRCSDYWRRHLAALDEDPTELVEFLGDAPGGRLGIYYERLWHYLLDRDPDIALLAHNLPVRDAGRTIGEFDCLYWSGAHNAHVHLELAVKFYLGIPARRYWLGPGGRDRLDTKLAHLRSRQSRLGAHPASKAPLRALGVDSCISLIDIKGYLFAPAAGMDPPRDHNPDNPLKHWYTQAEFAALPALPRPWVGWQKIPRRRWLSPYLAKDGTLRDTPALLDMLNATLTPRGRPLQLAACDDQGIERYRCFVVPDGWPDS